MARKRDGSRTGSRGPSVKEIPQVVLPHVDEALYIGYRPDIPNANGQGKSVEECKQNLAYAVALTL